MFSAGLVASRGLLPQAWEEEIAEDRRDSRVLLATFWEDVRYGCRVIRRNPLLSLVVILTLTVGIGINASIFTVVNGMMLKPHVYKDPASFVRIVPQSRLQREPRRASYQEYLHLRDQTRTIRQLAAFSYFPASIGDDDSGGSVGIAVSCNFFRVDGLDRAIVGRLIDGGDCGAPGEAPVAVIAEKVWHQRFASDPHIAGRITRVNNRPVTIVGVAPDLTTGWLTPPNVWIPFTAQPYMDSSHNGFTDDTLLWLTLAGRLAPGILATARCVPNSTYWNGRKTDPIPGRATAVTTTDGSWLSEFELYSTGARSVPAHVLSRLFHAGPVDRLRQRGHAPALPRRGAPSRDRRAPFARRATHTPGPHADHREPDYGGDRRRCQRLSGPPRAATALPLPGAARPGLPDGSRLAHLPLHLHHRAAQRYSFRTGPRAGIGQSRPRVVAQRV